jgi:hypothetical protein
MSIETRQRSTALQRFTGGLNNYWDQSSIDDSELASIVNFEFSTNGSLISRPPIYAEMNGTATIVSPVTGEPIDIIGTYVRQDGERFLVVTTDAKTWLYDIVTKSWTQIATFQASDCTQYMNKVVLCSTTVHGGYWEAGTFTTTNMPYLGGIEILQNRFFGYGVEGSSTANTVFWSDITTFGPSGEVTSVWDWIDNTGNYYYVDIGSGDGQWITAMAQGYNDLVIFRNKSTYRYSFPEDPALGTMQSMQQDIGAENKRCVVKFENAHYVLSGTILYKYQNWLYYPLNAQKVKFESSAISRRFQHAVSIIGRRAVVWHNGGIFAYNMDTNTWSEWQSEAHVGYFIAMPRRNEENAEELYYGISGSSAMPTGGFPIYRIENLPVSSIGTESMQCSLRTKIYDFNTPVEWKRLYYWAADVATSKPVKAIVYPVVLPETAALPTWDEIAKDFEGETGFYTWDMLSKDSSLDTAYGTWDDLVLTSGGIQTVISDFPTSYVQRIEAKLNQSLRFRRIYFELYLECDGTSSTSPVQVYSMTPMVGVKAKVAKGAN